MHAPEGWGSPDGTQPGTPYRCTSAAIVGLLRGCGGRSGCGLGISLLSRLRDKWFRVRHAAMACAAGDGISGSAVFQLRQVFCVEVIGHSDHHARGILDRVGVGGEVVAFRLRVSGMTEPTVDTEVALILMHHRDDLVSGDVFGKSLDVGWIGARASWWSRGLRCGSGGGRFLSQGEMGR
jgi:hypothetical protein